MEHPTAPAAALAHIEELARRGQLAEAEAACLEILHGQPQFAQVWAWLGTLRLALQRFAEAEAALRQAIALEGSDAHYWTNAAIALRAQRKSADAEALARVAVRLDPTHSSHWAGLAGALADQRRLEEAAAAYREAVARPGAHAGTWAEFATAEHLLGHFAQAHQAFERSLALDPSNLDVQTKYAMLLIDAGQPQDAVKIVQPIVAQAPQMTPAWMALGRAWWQLNEPPQAEAAFRRAIELAPGSREARHDLALVLIAQWLHAEAEAIVRQLLAENPGFAEGWLLLGVVLHVQSRIDEALPALRQAYKLSPTPFNLSKLLVSLHYSDDVTAEELLAEHLTWDEAFARPLLQATPPSLSDRRKDGPLRIGLVASDFSAGPTGFLALRAIECLDRTRCEAICYSDRLREDEYTARFRAAAKEWRTTFGVSDEDLARQVRADEIDILIDLSGHVGTRMRLFARKPAPLQVTWLGYVGTTGMAAMDCLLADRFHVREGEEGWYCEQVLRMPHGYACYGPPPVTPEVGPLPARENGFVTFGCFNNPVKFTPRLLDLWCEVLRRVPTARLLLKYFGLQQPHLQSWLRDQFSRRGVSPERLLLEGWSPHAELLAGYNLVDLALDTQPYSGGLTTCEALWMGVPVVTFPGRTFAGRHSTSHLTNAGYSQFVAAGAGEYVELAARWAEQLDELAAIREGLRMQMQRSPLCDAPRFAADWLSLLCTAWQTRPNRARAAR